MPALDQLRHLPEEEGEQQRADVRAVHVRVRHDDDAVVAQLVGVELLAADAGAERRDQRADLLAADSILSKRARSTLRIFPRKRQHGLEGAVAALLGGAAGRVALDEQDLAFRRIALLAIGELAGQRRDVERALAAGEFARLAGRLARGGGLHHLADERSGLPADAPRASC